MGLINRGAIVVKPKQPYLDWVRALPDPDTTVTLEELRQDCTVYLLPDWDDDDHLDRMLGKCARDIFEEQLSGWCNDERTWPQRRTLAALREWFDIEPHSMVMNLVEGPVLDEEDGA